MASGPVGQSIRKGFHCRIRHVSAQGVPWAAQHKQTGASHVRVAKALGQGRQIGRLARQFQPQVAPFFPGGSPDEL